MVCRQIDIFPALVLKRFLASTMDSYLKDTHKYAFELVKAAREMPVQKAEELDYIKELRSRHQVKALEKRINKKFR